MERQYIGARYVPRFLGVYDVTQIYEALDVVDNGAGTSYIARKIVPAGTPLTNTEYWFVYGASSGAIVQLQNDMTQAQNDITGLQGDMTQAQSDITGLESDMTTAEGNITSLLSDVGNLKSEAHKEILVIGNSYVQGGCASVIESLFDNAYEKTYGGAGFADFSGHTTTFETLIDQAIADASIPKDKITDILFISAHGDTAAYTEHGHGTYATKMATTFGAIQGKISTNFPNVNKVSITLGESRNQRYYSGSTFDSMFRVHGLFNMYASRYGFEYIGWTGFNLLFESAFFQNDNTHLTTAGYYVLGNIITSAYFGKLEYQPKSAVTIGMPFNYCSGGTCAVWVSYTPEETTVIIGQSTQGASDPVTISSGQSLVNLDHNSLGIGCPPPVNAITSIGPMFSSSGSLNVLDMMYISMGKGTNGILDFVSYITPRLSTATTAHFIVPNLNYTYKNY